jgi:N-acetylglucosaminyl-diphospho-decaprenol L-rhamnosyltransferase
VCACPCGKTVSPGSWPNSRVPGSRPVSADVVIVAHNAGGLLAGAVASAIAQAGAEHVWVMDAASSDCSAERLQEFEKDIHVVSIPNSGFAAANNRGMELTDAPFVLLLNPDAALRPGALGALTRTAETNPRTGIVGPLVVNTDGSLQANSYGRFPTLTGLLGLRIWRVGQRLRGNRKLSPKSPIATTPVDWVTGAAMLVSRAAIAEVGPMDEGFFLYYEDAEWCHRMRDHGWEVLLEPRAQVVHHLGSSAVAKDVVARAYRASFYRYCDLYGLWGLKALARVGLFLRRLVGGRS